MPNKKLLLHNRYEKIRHELHINNAEIGTEFRQEKFEKMSASPYAFYRGSNHLFWEDFYNDWRLHFFGGNPATLTWINGDAHIYNYGAYANHFDEAVFCMDDFDDAIVADYQFDYWRMAISLVLDCQEKGVFGIESQEKALKTFSSAYLKEVTSFDPGDLENEIHYTCRNSKGLLKRFLKKVEKKKSRLKMLSKWTEVVDGKRVFDTSNEKLSKISGEDYLAIVQSLEKYRKTLNYAFQEVDSHFKIKDIARRVKAGTGSLGSQRYYVLLEGDSSSQDDDVILDMKEQGKPPLYRHMNDEEKAEYDLLYPNEGERHAKAFYALAEHPDKYLGWATFDGVNFSIKQRSPYKSDFPSEKLKTDKELCFMANIWGQILGCRHKRASFILNGEAHEMPKKLAELTQGREKEFISLTSSIAIQYADRVNRDFEYFKNIIHEAE